MERKPFCKEVSKVKKECGFFHRITNKDGAFVTDKTGVRKLWKEHFENISF